MNTQQEEPLTLEAVRDQARRYMEAVYGKAIWFAAPETINNVLERWIWGVASNAPSWAEESITRIEEMAALHRQEHEDS